MGSGSETTSDAESRRFGGAVLITVGFLAVQLIAALLNNVALARFVGPSGRGTYAIIVASLALLWPVFGLGLGPATTFYSAKPRFRLAVHSLALVALFATALPLVGTGVAILSLWPLDDGGGNVSLFGVALVIVPATIAGQYGAASLLGRGKILAFNLLSTFPPVGLAIANACTLRLGVEWVALNLFLVYVAFGVAGIGVLLRNGGRPKQPEAEFARRALRYGGQATAWQLAETALMRIDYLVLAAFAGTAALGIFAIADQLSAILALVGTAAGRVVFAESASDHSGRRSRTRVELAARLLLTCGVPIGIVWTALWWVATPFAFGPQFGGVVWALVLLVPANLLRGHQALLATYLAGQGQQRGPVVAAAAAIGTTVTVGVVAIAMWGWAGAVLCRCIAYLVQYAVVRSAYTRSVGRGGGGIDVLSGADVRNLRALLSARLSGRAI